MINPNMGAPKRSFPNEKKNETLSEEDAFMQEHGGSGPGLIHWIMEKIFDFSIFLKRK